jgi:protocatechuate 3,4-dioxygenase beta subunit
MGVSRKQIYTEVNMDRRKLLKKSIVGAGFLSAGSVKATSYFLDQCELTPAQTEGPFYPASDQLDKNADLVVVRGRSKQAIGKIVYLVGQVRDQNCRIVPNALVEIWQACHSGKYNHRSDPNKAPLDPDFQYWGQSITDKNGRYAFRTIVPGAYPATSTWMRPPHIHLKVHLRGYEELTTQVYFKNHPLNKTDRILNALSTKDRDQVLVDFKREKDKVIGKFDITINTL